MPQIRRKGKPRKDFLSTVKSLDPAKEIVVDLDEKELSKNALNILTKIIKGEVEIKLGEDDETKVEKLLLAAKELPHLYQATLILDAFVRSEEVLQAHELVTISQLVLRSELNGESMKLLCFWRLLLKVAYGKGQISQVGLSLMQASLDIWQNIAVGGVIYLDDYICAVYGKSERGEIDEDCDLKIAVVTPWNGWSYWSPWSKKVPIASLRGLKAAIDRAKLDPKLQGLSGELVSENYRLARFLGMEVVNNRAYLT